MKYLLLLAPSSLASGQSQANELTIEAFIKSIDEAFTILLCGELCAIQRYISQVYTVVWDYSLLHGKTQFPCTVLYHPYDEVIEWLNQQEPIVLSVPSYLENERKNIIQELTKRGHQEITFDVIHTIHWTEDMIALDWESSTFCHVKTACVGGTFDCLHPGHRILLTLASLVCDRLIIGLTADALLETKLQRDKIASYNQRKQGVVEFLKQVAPKLEVVISPLTDIYGPSVVKEDLDAIIVSLETLVGAEKINKVRKEKGMKPLTVFTVNRSSRYTLSSSFIRTHSESLSYSLC